MDQDQPSKGIAAFSLRNPHFIVVMCLTVILLGGLAVFRLPKDLLPASNLPAVQILSFYTGMPVDYVEKSLTARYERFTGQAIGIIRQESRSLVGVCVVKNFFNSSVDLNTAITQITSLSMSVMSHLPPGTQPPLILPFDPMAAVLWLWSPSARRTIRRVSMTWRVTMCETPFRRSPAPWPRRSWAVPNARS